MDLKQLRCFIAVAEELHFGRAATRLNMAPPALSRQVRLLEDELDVRLFSRTTRTVTMTRAGAAFLDEARDILARTKSATKVVQEAARSEENLLRIGALDSAAAGLLPEVMFTFRQQHPDVRIQLMEATTSRQLQGLVTGRLDLGFLHPPVMEPDLAWEFVLQEQLLVALPLGHALSNRLVVGLPSLVREPLILPAKRVRPCTYNLVVKCFESIGAQPNIVQEATEKQTIVSMVAAGMGVALVPDWVAKLRVPGVIYKPLAHALGDPPPPEVTLGVCWRVHQRLHARDLFLEHIRQRHGGPAERSAMAKDNVTVFPGAGRL